MKFDELSIVISTPSIWGVGESSSTLIHENRFRYMSRRMYSIFGNLLCTKTIRHSFHVLHSPKEMSRLTAGVMCEEFNNHGRMSETHYLYKDTDISIGHIGPFLDKLDVEILVLISDPDLESTSLIKRVSNISMTRSEEKHLDPGQSIVWYQKCNGFEYITWDGRPLLIK
jgi:hypothetical protein